MSKRKTQFIFFFNWLANWPQNDKGPGNLTLVTSELRGVWGRFYFQELVSNLFSLWILSDSIIQFLFFFQDFAAGLAVLQRGRWIYVQLSKWNGLRSWTLQKKYENGLVSIFADYQKQKFQHERCRKNMEMDLCFLRIIKNRKNMEINFLRVVKKINTPHIKRKARMLQW